MFKKIKHVLYEFIDPIMVFRLKYTAGFKNLIRWFPVIWNDRDWDHVYLYEILQFKLKGMEKLHRKWGHAVNSKRTANEIKLCILLLDRLIKDKYLNNVLKPHEKKWGDDNDLFFNNKTSWTKLEEQELKERRRLYKHSDYLLIQDIDMLFKTMNKHITGWWD